MKWNENCLYYRGEVKSSLPTNLAHTDLWTSESQLEITITDKWPNVENLRFLALRKIQRKRSLYVSLYTFIQKNPRWSGNSCLAVAQTMTTKMAKSKGHIVYSTDSSDVYPLGLCIRQLSPSACSVRVLQGTVSRLSWLETCNLH